MSLKSEKSSIEPDYQHPTAYADKIGRFRTKSYFAALKISFIFAGKQSEKIVAAT